MRFPTKLPTWSAGSASSKGLLGHFTIGNMLAVVGIGIPFLLGAIRARTVYNNFHAKYFPNVLHVQLHTISRSPISRNLPIPKYRVYTRTIYEREIDNIIFNEHGIKVLQKASRKCTFDNPLIRINPIEDHYYICNSILIKLNECFSHFWISRDMSIDSCNDIIEKDVLKSKMYLFTLLSTLNSKKAKTKRNSIFNPHLQPFYMGKIRAFLIQEHFIREILELCHSCGKDIHHMTHYEWRSYLDHDIIDNHNIPRIFDYTTRWDLIRHIIMEYDKHIITDESNNQLKWGHPLCMIEIPSEIIKNEDKQQPFNPPIHNAFHTYLEIPHQDNTDIQNEEVKLYKEATDMK